MNEYQILNDLVKMNTIKDKENRKIIDYIEVYLQKLGFQTEYKSKLLIMKIGEKPHIGFLGHTDTVEYIDEFKNPFELKNVNGFLYGLGTCDMKGGIAAMLEAVSKIDFSKCYYGMKLYFTYDEEIGFGGVKELVSRGEVFPPYMIFGEPTNNEIYTGHKGLLLFEVHMKGKKAHSSNPEKGISANLNAVKFLYELEQFYQKKIRNDLEKHYDIPYTTMNVGILQGGSAMNSVPAFCKFTMDFRIANSNHISKIQREVKKLAEKYFADVKEVECILPFVDEIDFLHVTKTTNFMTEASRVYGSQRIILGPGPVTAHEVNERISIESYKKLVEQYQDLIYQVCKSKALSSSKKYKKIIENNLTKLYNLND